MIPRQTPLCVTHFLSYAQNKPNGIRIRSGTKAARKKTTKNPPPPTRVQPRRAAKDKVKAYTEDNVEEYEKEAAKAIEPTTSHCKSPLLRIEALIEQERFRKDCIFGTKPLVCEQCRKDTIAANPSSGIATGTPKGRVTALEATMEPDSDVRVTLDWNDIEIAKDRQFQWGNHWFAVDICNVPMILMLE